MVWERDSGEYGDMNIDIPGLVDAVSQHAWLVIALIAAAALAEAALGFGAIVPGETIVVLGAVVLSNTSNWWVVSGCLAVAVAASAGDHIGWWIGRKAGPPMRDSKVVKSVGTGYWDKAMNAVDRQGLFPLVLARQLPGVRTLVAAACGAARVPYRRFATASVIGAVIWSLLWVGGGAIAGRALLEFLGPILPIIVVVWIAGVVGLVIFRTVRNRRNRSRKTA